MLRSIVIVMSLLIAVSQAEAQIEYGKPPSASAGFVYQSWTIKSGSGDKSELSQWYFPLYGYLPVAESWEIHATVSSAGSRSDSAGVEASISGLNDSRVSLLHSTLENRLLLGVGINVPTGKSELEGEQVALGRLLAEDYLDIPSKRFSEGMGLDLECAYVHDAGDFTVGGAADYYISTSHSPVRGVSEYNDGSVFTIAVNVMRDHRFGRASLSIKHRVYATSTQENFGIYKIGPITELAMYSDLAVEKVSANGGIRVLFRRADSRLESGTLTRYEKNNNGTEIRLFASLGYSLQRIGVGSIQLGYKHIAANAYELDEEDYIGSSSLYSFGVGLTRNLSGRYWGAIGLAARTGSADGGYLDLSGSEFTLKFGGSLQ
jgi:hypothetical protein